MKRIPFNALIVLVCLARSDFGIFAQTGTPNPVATSQQGATSQASQLQQKTVTKSADAADSVENPEDEIPVVRLEFKPAGVVPGVSGTSAFTLPVVCSADGVPYMSFLDAKSGDVQSVTSLDPKGSRIVSTQQIQGLYGISSILGVFVTDSMVGLRITATKDPTKSPQTVDAGEGTPPRDVYSGKRHFFLAKFDLSGNFTKAVELPEDLFIWRLAALPDDSLLALGYDLINARPHLVILDSGGERKRDLQIPAMMDENPVFSEASSGDWKKRNRAMGALSSWQFAWARQRVLLFQAHSSAPILEVGAGGAVREVTIEQPKGYGIDSVLPSNDRWLVSFRKDGLSNRGAIDADPKTKNFVLYEVDPADGSLRRRIEIPEEIFYTNVSCEKDGTVTAFTTDQGKVNLFSADLGR
jgi:hypothetical protein